MKNALATIATLIVLTLGLFPASSSAQDGPATRYLRQRHDQVLRDLRRPASEARTRAISEQINGLLDVQALSRGALAQHWGAMNAAQQTEFVRLLTTLIERQYQRNLERIEEAEVAYLGEESSADGVIVHTQVRSRTSRRAAPVQIDYRAHNEGSVWRVTDIVTDDVSLVNNYRRQFGRIISTQGIDELLRRMRDRVASGQTE